MHKFYTLLSREVRSYFYSPVAYIVLVFFLFVTGADFYFQLSYMNQRPFSYSVQEAFFNSVAHQYEDDTSFDISAAGSGAKCTITVLDGRKVLAQQSFVSL